MTLGLLTTTLFSPISLLRTTPVTAETTPATLEPGETINTDPKTLDTADFQNKSTIHPLVKIEKTHVG